MATSQVDTWIQNTTAPAAPSEVNTEIHGYAAKELQSKHLGVTVEDHGYSAWDPPIHVKSSRVDEVLPHRDATNTPSQQHLPFPLPKDISFTEETPTTTSPSTYLQRWCPICFSATKPELKLSWYVSDITFMIHDWLT
jgi:hypothetical protein